MLSRYVVVSPATSEEVARAIHDAIQDGTLRVKLTIQHTETHQEQQITFRPKRAKLLIMSVEHTGITDENEIATIITMTHPDLSSDRARLTLVSRSTP